ncbi:MAG: hypothetical protein JST05_09210 [Acidobacteria bacterium]|nr:hypothetical protein [Acidobacteriota bacterium]
MSRRLPVLALLLAAPLLAGDGIQAIPLRTTLRAESLRLPGDESMGLIGLSTTADFGGFYLGPGLYGAARGQRGGLFTFGLEGGYRARPFPRMELEAGLFIGGGGGAAAPQGGGLMLRPHAGFAFVLGRARLGADLSRVRFPNGGIDSTQAALTFAFTTDSLWAPEGGTGDTFTGAVDWRGHEWEGSLQAVHPATAARTRSGGAQPAFDLAGFRLSSDLGGPLFRYLAVDGAARGSSAGYAQVVGGLGLRARLLGPVGVEARAGLGLGGGGDTDTGGGFLLTGDAALTARFGGWRASAGLGYLKAPGGTFAGKGLFLRLAHRIEAPKPEADGGAIGTFDLSGWRFGSGLLVYRHAQRTAGGDGTIQAITLRADRMLVDGFYLSGEAGSATGGGAGGYSTGLAGAGWQTPPFARQRVFLEVAAGAGGGGGLDTKGGLLLSARAGWRLDLPHGLGLEASAGKVRAPRGALDSTTYSAGLSLRFNAPERVDAAD